MDENQIKLKNDLEGWAKTNPKYFLELSEFYYNNHRHVYDEFIIPLFSKYKYNFAVCEFCNCMVVPVKQKITRAGRDNKSIYKSYCPKCRMVISESHRFF